MGQWDKLTEICLISAAFIVVFLLTYLVFKLRERRRRKKRSEILLPNESNNIVPCRQCQLIAMGEMASYNGFCPICEKIPPPLVLFGIA